MVSHIWDIILFYSTARKRSNTITIIMRSSVTSFYFDYITLTRDVCSCKVSCKVSPLEPRLCVCVRACVRLCFSLYLEAEADVLAVYALVPHGPEARGVGVKKNVESSHE